MPIFRCTRPDLYRPGTAGHTNPSARQGHYIEAATDADAVLEMSKSYPRDLAFDVQHEDDQPWETAPARRHPARPKAEVCSTCHGTKVRRIAATPFPCPDCT